MSKFPFEFPDPRHARQYDEAQAELESAVQGLWSLGLEEDEIVEQARAIVAEYAADTERLGDTRAPHSALRTN